MDSVVDSSIDYNTVRRFRQKNVYRLNVTPPKFNISSFDSVAYVSDIPSKELQDITEKIQKVSASKDDINDIVKSIDPFYYAIKRRSERAYTREYYDLMGLNSQMDLINPEDIVYCFSPKFTAYIIEMGAIPVNFILGAYENKPSEDKKFIESMPAKLFASFKNYTKDYVFVLTDFDHADFNARWTYIDILSEMVGYSDVIINVESEEGKTGKYQGFLENRHYSYEFFEPAIYSLKYLKPGGKLISKLNSFGTKFIADLIYLYKYFFAEVIIIKPSTTDPVGLEHYVVCKGFNAQLYKSSQDYIKDLLIKIDSHYVDGDIDRLGSFIESDMDEDFVRWITQVNDDIALSIYTNCLALENALKLRDLSFYEGHPYFVYDYVKYRQSLGLDSRKSLIYMPEMEFSDKIYSNDVEIVTQMTDPIIKLSDNIKMGDNFLKYIALSRMANMLIKHFQTVAKIDYNVETMKSSVYSWISMIYFIGDIDNIFDDPTNFLNDPTNFLNDLGNGSNYEKLNMKDVFGYSYDGLKMENVIKALQGSANLYNNLKKYSARKSGNLIDDVKIHVKDLHNLRFRVTLFLKSSKHILNDEINVGVIGEYEIMNLLTSDEKLQITNPHQLKEIALNPKFHSRLIETISLPVLMSNRNTTISAFQLYHIYKPEIEAFASSVNRHAPIWFSKLESDKELGSQGDFFKVDVANKIFDDSKLMIAFPPIHFGILTNTIRKCLEIIKHRPDANFAIILVIDSDPAYKDHLSMISHGQILQLLELNDVYEPFNGIISKRKLTACLMKTKSSDFTF